MIDILVVDDHTIFRSGLKRLLSDESDIRVVAETGNGAEVLSKLRSLRIHAVILDINLSGRSGLDVLKQIRQAYPRMPILVMSMYPAEQFAVVAFSAGANSYLSKDVGPEELLRAIRTIVTGSDYVTRQLSTLLTQGPKDDADAPSHYALSARELQILLGIVDGKSLTKIGSEMFLSVKTVSTYRSRILEKLNLSSNAELVRYAAQFGLR